jgi:PPOX class probable F420-dependent enzyme
MGKKLQGDWAVYVALEKIGMLSTVDPDGTPNSTPVFYALMDGEVYVGTQRSRKKFSNMQSNPKVCFTIDTPKSPYKGIMIQGTAEVIDNDEIHGRFHEALMYRYYGHPDSAGWKYIQSLGASALVKINANKIFHWDFS